jgi:trigger factor
MQADAKDLTERLEREKLSLEQYLEASGKTREQVEAELANVADRRIRTGLVLAEVAQIEQMTVEDADIEAEIAERAERARVSPAAVRAFVEKQNQMEALANRVLTQKVFTFLRDNAQITDRVLTSEEMDAEMQDEAAEEEDGEPETDAAAPAAPLGVEGAVVARRRSGGAKNPDDAEDTITTTEDNDATPPQS